MMDFLKTAFEKLLCRVTGYYEDGNLYRFAYSKAGIEMLPLDTDAKVPLILIVARQHYQETINKYPVDDNKQLLKILKIAFGQACHKYLITHQEQNQSTVNVWEFDKSVPKSWLIFPETYLLQQQIANNHCIIKDTAKKRLFIASFNQAVSSVYESSLVNSVARFALSLGQSLDTVQSINHQALPKVLINSLFSSSKQHWFRFTQASSISATPLSLSKITLPVVLILSGYFLLTSLYLLWQQNALASNYQDQKDAVEAALVVQNKVDAAGKELQVMQQFIEQQQATSDIWLLLFAILDKTDLSVCRYQDGRFTLIGETEKATSLLAQISQMPIVEDARFDVPIRMTKRSESFSISFRLKNNNHTSEAPDV